MLYYFYPDETISAFTDWVDIPEDNPPKGTYLYEPLDKTWPWVEYFTIDGNVRDVQEINLPKWVRAYVLLLE